MYAAVLHTIGTGPRYEEFPEPVISDDVSEAIVHVHAASLKPVDRQLASGSHYASPRPLPCVCGSDGVGHLEMDDGSSSADLDHLTVRWRSVQLSCALTFPVPENVKTKPPPLCPILESQPGFHSPTAQSWFGAKTSLSWARPG